MAKKLIDLIDKRRQALGLTQVDLAARCGLSRDELNRYLRGRVQPSAEKLDTLLAALGFKKIDWK